MPQPKEIASAPIVSTKDLKGGTLHVYELRAASGSTRLLWAVTVPQQRGSAGSLALYGGDLTRHLNHPRLVLGKKTYAPLEVAQGDGRTSGWYPASPPDMAGPGPQARTLYTVFPPLPAGTAEVELSTPLLAKPLKVKVEQGPEALAPSVEGLPVLGRAQRAYAHRSGGEGQPGEVVMGLHGVRRAGDSTVVYYSFSVPKGAQQTPLNLTWSYAPFGYFTGYQQKTTQMVAVVDRASMTALTPLGAPLENPSCKSLPDQTLTEADAFVCASVLPPLPAGSSTVDVELGTRAYFQDVPVEEGLLLAPSEPTPSSSPTDGTVARLGERWPSPSEKALSMVKESKWVDLATTKIRDAITDGAVTDKGGKQVDLNTSVLFEYNKATLTPAASVALDKAVAIIGKSKPGKLKVVGHTDSDGEDAYNVELSRKRAQAVADALKPKLGAGWSFAVEGKGEAEPVASNETDQGKQLNRRVTITIPE